MNALAVARSSFATSLARYRRSWGLWLLLLVAPVSARYWIAGKDAASAAIVVNGKAPVLTSAVVGLSLGVILSTVLLPIIFIYLRSNTTRHQLGRSKRRPRRRASRSASGASAPISPCLRRCWRP
ncbi:hypothetical protein [Lysobacter capsici]|uniref:hypothetical protein n=1 Tax=Lysobacter capsici TaxID=435897 RepID=UPI00398D1C94